MEPISPGIADRLDILCAVVVHFGAMGSPGHESTVRRIVRQVPCMGKVAWSVGRSRSRMQWRRTRRGDRWIGVSLLLVVLVLVAGCGTDVPASMRVEQGGLPVTVDVPTFASAVSSQDYFVVDVHAPDEGSIPGTNARIPFDQLDRRAAELPRERSTPIAVYCMTGRMSEIAVRTLSVLGFTEIVELGGGMKAWKAEGRDLLPPGE